MRPFFRSRLLRWGVSGAVLSLAGCGETADPEPPIARPAIDVTEQRICPGEPLPLTYIDAVLPGPDGLLALVGHSPGPADPDEPLAIRPVVYQVAIVHREAPSTVIELIERSDPENRPTPVGWGPGGLLVTHHGETLALPETPGAPVFRTPWGISQPLDPATPNVAVDDDRAVMVIGWRQASEPHRVFAEIERGDPAAGTVDRIVATYGAIDKAELIELARPIFPVFGEDEFVVHDVTITDWLIEPGGRLVALGDAWINGVSFGFIHTSSRERIDADPEAGWFDRDDLRTADQSLVFYDVLQRLEARRLTVDETGRGLGVLDLVLRYQVRPVYVSVDDRGWLVEHHTPPAPEDEPRVLPSDWIAADGQEIVGGAVCIDAIDHCRPAVVRRRGETARDIIWSVTIGTEGTERVHHLQQAGDQIVAFAGISSPRYGPLDADGIETPGPFYTATPPVARVAVIDRDGNCLARARQAD